MKILATIKKEWLMLLRDPMGLVLIFLMPMCMVTVMSLVMDAPFRDYTQYHFDILLVNEDRDSMGVWVKEALESSGTFGVFDTAGGNPLTRQQALDLVQAGKYKAALFIPAGCTRNVTNNARLSIQNMLSGFGMGEPNSDTILPAPKLELAYDPITKANFRQSLNFAVEKMTAALQTKMLMNQLTGQMKTLTGTAPAQQVPMGAMVQVVEQHPHDKAYLATLNSVQHNVPGWTMFAMFFILFPLAGNFIKEREDGSLLRMRLVAGSQFPYVFGKYLFHFFICILQFFLMLSVGLWLLPKLGLPRLLIGEQHNYLVVTALILAFAATAYGLFVGVVFKTHYQALAFGSVTVVMLAALGGVWVPSYVMPPFLKTISVISPMSWGMELCNNVFLRQAQWQDLMPSIMKLGLFGSSCLLIAFIVHHSRQRS
ncbi:MAG: ABC transporter permease [Chitinophagales bacterium]